MQKRITIEPHDILAIEYECTHCKCRHSVRIDAFRQTQMKCPVCNEDWIRGEYNGPERTDQTLPQFARYLTKLQSVANGATIRLVIDSPTLELSREPNA